MKILISNDDGILARGLAVLGDVCAALGQVTVVAPDREQSGTSHSLTLHRPLHATRRPDGAFQVDGTPTDCVLLAIGMLMPQKPAFLISGINHGQNMGEDVFYSGTVAAAMEGLVAGIPSIAVSYAGADLDMLETHKDGLRSLLRRIVEVQDFPTETLLNINLPALPGDQVKGVKVTHLGSRVFSEEIALMKDPWGKEIYWIGGGRITWSGDADCDFRTTSDGNARGPRGHRLLGRARRAARGRGPAGAGRRRKRERLGAAGRWDARVERVRPLRRDSGRRRRPGSPTAARGAARAGRPPADSAGRARRPNAHPDRAGGAGARHRGTQHAPRRGAVRPRAGRTRLRCLRRSSSGC